jgi:hypothetical protein
LLVLATTHVAQADGRTCTTAAEDGQRARAAGQLRTAHRLFLTCSEESCPALVRRDCAEWASSIAAMMPSIVIDARDASGRDVGDVTVTVDGEVVAHSLDGKSLPIDPGPHTLVFARQGSAPVTEKVIIKEGARGRTFVVKFGGATAPPPAAPDAAGTAPANDTSSAAPEAERHHTVWPWLVVGTGTVILTLGVIVWVTSPDLPEGCTKASETCTKIPPETATSPSFLNRQKEAGESKNQPIVAAMIMGTGAVVVAGGLIWHFLEPTGPRKSGTDTRLVPWSTAEGAGLAAMGRF